MDPNGRMEVVVGGAKYADTETAASSMGEGEVFFLAHALVVECPDSSTRVKPPSYAVVYGRNR